MYFTPIVPVDIVSSTINKELLDKAETLCIESAKLVGSHNIHIINAIKDILRRTNSYYSNRIESEGTHPIDIDRAMNKDFSTDPKKKDLQILSIVHIEVQKSIEIFINEYPKPYSREIILRIHEEFYSKNGMEPFLDISHDGIHEKLIPGKTRERDVIVGEHIAPKHEELNSILTSFETLYNGSCNSSKSIQLLHALCSHHRLVWIHPFLDGNGRVSRLFLDSLFLQIGIEGYGLWNISRGLARKAEEYKKYLKLADMVVQGATDGRGPLSNRGLNEFLNFMLDIALDQIQYMNKYLKLDSLASNITKYVSLSQAGLFDHEALPAQSELLFKELLIYGELPRGQVKNIIGKKDRAATSLISKLMAMDFLESDSPKGNIRLKFNSHFASKIIPELFPDK